MMKWLKNRSISHRGLHKSFIVPENSMMAFSKAVKKNYSIELDVRLTKDNQVIVFHDRDLLRMCEINKKVKDLTFDELKDYRLYNSMEKIPLFKDVLLEINGKAALLIEIKNYHKAGSLEKEISKLLDNYKGKFAICSFNPDVVNWFKINRPNYKRGIIFADIKKFKKRSHEKSFLKSFFKLQPDFVSLNYRLINTLIPNFCKKKRIPIVTWTIDSKKKRDIAMKYVNNVIFEGFTA